MAALGWGLGLLVGVLLAFGAQRLRGNTGRALAILGLVLALGWTVVWLNTVLNSSEKWKALLVALALVWLLGLGIGLPRAVVRQGKEPVWIGLGLSLLMITIGPLLLGGGAMMVFHSSSGFAYGLLLSLLPAAALAAVLDRRQAS